MTIKLYHCVDARSFRPLWALEELELDYELVLLPFPPRVRQKTFLATNPLGTIPFLEHGAARMTESAAMVQYISDVCGAGRLSVRADEPGYGAYLNALHQGEATLTFPQTLVLRYARLEPPERRKPDVAADYSRWFLSRLRWVDALLAQSDYVAADRFTGADISVAYALMLGETLGLAGDYPERVQAYHERMSERAGFKAAKVSQSAGHSRLAGAKAQ